MHERYHEGMAKVYARSKFDTDINKRKVLDNFFAMLKRRGVEKMYYGDAMFDSSGKGEESVPVKGVAEACM